MPLNPYEEPSRNDNKINVNEYRIFPYVWNFISLL